MMCSRYRGRSIGAADQEYTDVTPQEPADLHLAPETGQAAQQTISPDSRPASFASNSGSQVSTDHKGCQPQRVSGSVAASRSEPSQMIPSEGAQAESNTASGQLPSAEQLWDGAWKAFEAPEDEGSLSTANRLPSRPTREEHQQITPPSSFPSLAARLFSAGGRSKAQDLGCVPAMHHTPFVVLGSL